MTGYELSRQWFDWSFENPHLSTPNHTALYLWYVEKWNRCGQKEKFSVTTSESMEAIGIKSRNTLSNTFKDLVAWNFIIIITESKNQHSCSVISLAQILSKHEYSTVASTRTALDKALIQHEYSTVASTDTINKQDNKETSKQDNQETKEEIPKEISPSDLENEKLRLEVEELKKHILDAENKERKSSAKKKERFEPPTVEDVENYFVENGYKKDSGTRAYNYYAIAEWRDSKGNQVKNWKQKMQAVWFKEENKIITNYAITNNTRPERTYGSAPEGKRGTHLIPIPNECDTSNERYEVEGFYYGDV